MPFQQRISPRKSACQTVARFIIRLPHSRFFRSPRLSVARASRQRSRAHPRRFRFCPPDHASLAKRNRLNARGETRPGSPPRAVVSRTASHQSAGSCSAQPGSGSIYGYSCPPGAQRAAVRTAALSLPAEIMTDNHGTPSCENTPTPSAENFLYCGARRSLRSVTNMPTRDAGQILNEPTLPILVWSPSRIT